MLQIRLKFLKKLSVLLIFLLSLHASLYADQLAYNTYYVADNSQVNIFTTSFSLAKSLYKHTTLLLDIELDQVGQPLLTSASLDVISSASRPKRNVIGTGEYKKNRGQFIVGLEQGLGDNTRFALNYYNSQEEDYQSQSGIATLTQELFEKNLTLSLRGQYNMDIVGEIISDEQMLENNKEVFQLSFGLTQLLSPTTFMRMGVDERLDSGFLSDPYKKIAMPNAINPVIVDYVTGNAPTERYRSAGWLEMSHFLSDLNGSVIGHYRYYQDDWEIISHTFKFIFNKYITDHVIFSPEYRYYTQTAAYFVSSPGKNGYYSRDPKLQAHDAHYAGANLSYYLGGFAKGNPDLDFLQNSSWDIMYFRYFDTLKYSSNVMETQIKFSF